MGWWKINGPTGQLLLWLLSATAPGSEPVTKCLEKKKNTEEWQNCKSERLERMSCVLLLAWLTWKNCFLKTHLNRLHILYHPYLTLFHTPGLQRPPPFRSAPANQFSGSTVAVMEGWGWGGRFAGANIAADKQIMLRLCCHPGWQHT